MPQPQQFSWHNSRILIADDEPDMREIFAAWFRQLGCIVTEAADGQEALDAVSCDALMPLLPTFGCLASTVSSWSASSIAPVITLRS